MKLQVSRYTTLAFFCVLDDGCRFGSVEFTRSGHSSSLSLYSKSCSLNLYATKLLPKGVLLSVRKA